MDAVRRAANYSDSQQDLTRGEYLLCAPQTGRREARNSNYFLFRCARNLHFVSLPVKLTLRLEKFAHYNFG